MEREIRQLAEIIYGERGSNLVVIAARPFMGKTMLSIRLTHHFIMEEKATAFFSMKLPSNRLMRYLLFINTNIELEKIKQGSLSDMEQSKINKASSNLSRLPLSIYDGSTFSVETIKEKAFELKNTTGLDLLFIDYLQLLTSSVKCNSRQEEITIILSELKAIAEELAVSIIVLSQLSRSVEEKHDKRPEVNDLYEIGQVEPNADKIIFLYSDAYYSSKPSEASSTEIIIAKDNNGKPGKIIIDEFINYS